MFLTQYFRDRAAKRAAETQKKAQAQESYDAALTAIRQKNSVKLDEILSTPPSFNRKQFQSLVDHAIDSDEPAIFGAVLDRLLKGNVNHEFYSHFGMLEGPHHYDYKTLLYKTIERGGEDIALMLARNPETDLEYSGYSAVSRYRSGGLMGTGHMEEKKTDYPPPLEAAKQRGMFGVAAVLAEGLAARRFKEAVALRQRADIPTL